MIDDFFDFIGELASGPNWRYWITIGSSLIASVVIHTLIPGNLWDWFISVPLVIASIYLGWRWRN
ncbi:hypothetical protein MLD52_21625 [Puniceicoccaceae bacterium K14]|nr:hypothetical protein [Puniceicoccaceae bacterium K14]